MVVLSNTGKKAHKVDHDNFVNTDKCKQGKTWHKHYQVQSRVHQHRGGKRRLRPQATVTHQELPSHADVPVGVAPMQRAELAAAAWIYQQVDPSPSLISHPNCEQPIDKHE